MKKTYSPDELSFLNNRQAKIIGKELDRIADEKGSVTAKHVLADAIDPKSLLHPFFEWDNHKAGEKYRLYQAKKLIRSVRVTFDEGDKVDNVRAFIKVKKHGYQPVDTAMTTTDWRENIVEKALRDLHFFEVRYQSILKIAKFFSKLEEAKTILKKRLPKEQQHQLATQ